MYGSQQRQTDLNMVPDITEIEKKYLTGCPCNRRIFLPLILYFVSSLCEGKEKREEFLKATEECKT